MKSPIENHIVDLLLPADERRLSDALSASKPLPASNLEECTDLLRKKQTATIEFHQQWKESLAAQTKKVNASLDDLDRFLDEEQECDPYNGDPPSRRKDKAVSKLLDLLDSLQVSIKNERGAI